MNIELVKDADKAILFEYEALIERCVKNRELASDTFAMQNTLRPLIKYYGLELGCLCNASGWLKSLEYLLAVIKELHAKEVAQNETPKQRKRRTK